MPSGLILPYTDNYAAVLRDESRTVGYADTVSFPAARKKYVRFSESYMLSPPPLPFREPEPALPLPPYPSGDMF